MGIGVILLPEWGWDKLIYGWRNCADLKKIGNEKGQVKIFPKFDLSPASDLVRSRNGLIILTLWEGILNWQESIIPQHAYNTS